MEMSGKGGPSGLPDVRVGASPHWLTVFPDQFALLTFSIRPWDLSMASADIFMSFSI